MIKILGIQLALLNPEHCSKGSIQLAQATINAESLEIAFNEFNQYSSQLETSYRALSDRVAALTTRLEAARAAEQRQFAVAAQLSQRMKHLLDVLPAAVIVIDRSGMIRECNRRAIELLETPLFDCAWSVVVQREFCGDQSRDGELKLKNGRWLSLARRSLGAEEGEILLLTDITESRRTAECLQRSERLTSIGEMTARLGHQIRTPLASAMLYAGKLASSGTGSQVEAAGNINRRLRDMSALVNDMLVFAAGAKTCGDDVPVSELLHEVAEEFALQMNGGEIRIEVAADGLGVRANRGALHSALSNLVQNAMQACTDTPVITLSAVRGAERICLTVSDNGRGVPENIRKRIFEPFFTTRPQGTGLGLAVVRSVAEAHGGELLLDCGPQGTAFSICLPTTPSGNNCDE